MSKGIKGYRTHAGAMMGDVMKIMWIKPRLNSEAVTVLAGLITTITLLAFVRAIRPINLSLHRDLA